MKKKILALCLVIALAATAVIGGTLAYFTSEDEVTNTFTVGNVKITLDEAEVDADGKALTSGERTSDGNEYKLFPGGEYDKDPTVHVQKGSEDCYVRMFAKFNKARELSELTSSGAIDASTISEWATVNTTDWMFKSYAVAPDDDDTVIYEFWYKEKVTGATEKAVDLPALFTNIKVPAKLDNDAMAKIDGLNIKVTAEAIQADGFTTADAAWAALAALNTPAE